MYTSGFGVFYRGGLQTLRSFSTISGGIIRKKRNFLMNTLGSWCFPLSNDHCGELRLYDIGSTIEVFGKMQNQQLERFLTLRHDSGTIHLLVPDKKFDVQRRLKKLPLKIYMALGSMVTIRPENSMNEKMLLDNDMGNELENLMANSEWKESDSATDKSKQLRKSDHMTFPKVASADSSNFYFAATPNLNHNFSIQSHRCGELSKRRVGKNITLCVWLGTKGVERIVTLKDDCPLEVLESQILGPLNQLQNLQVHSILVVKGMVSRPDPNIENSDIEILVDSVNVVNPRGTNPYGREDSIGSGDGDGGGDEYDATGKGGVFSLAKADTESVPNLNRYCSRSHTCGELDECHIGQRVRLMGWIEYIRMNKFILLRDAYGKVQLVFPESKIDFQDTLKKLTVESVISVEGLVCARPPGQQNPKQKTGAIEVYVTDLKVLNVAKLLPFTVRDFNKPRESLRMKYRYLDLRYEYMQRNLRTRSKMLHEMRSFLIDRLGFVEVETPTLFKRTPGGAQEFIVPTQTEGKFYSLVQSPQQFKQLLMIGSIDKYFQVARCYRDESSRNDRQPEFTQLDIEMSFCQREDILNLIEDLLKCSWPCDLTPLTTPFPRLSFEEAMEFYGTDKPDLGLDWKLTNLTEVFNEGKNNCKEKYNYEKYLIEKDFAVYGLVGRKGGGHFSKKIMKNIHKEMQETISNTSFLFVDITCKAVASKRLETLFGANIANGVEKIMNYNAGDVLFIAIGSKKNVRDYLGKIRTLFADSLEEKKNESIRKGEFNFAWVLDFPLFELKENRIHSCHHPFTQPHPDDAHLLETHPLQVRGMNFDLVLNGNEVGGGSMRIIDVRLQKMVFEEILKINSESISHLLEGLESGAPPHGGIALGIDRILAVLCKAQSIRDVMAFPKTHLGADAMSGAPSTITDEERKLYHIPLGPL